MQILTKYNSNFEEEVMKSERGRSCEEKEGDFIFHNININDVMFYNINIDDVMFHNINKGDNKTNTSKITKIHQESKRDATTIDHHSQPLTTIHTH